MNHFEFYGIPLAFAVDEAALRRIYLLNSKKYHPDFHTLSDEAEQSRVLGLSTRNNEAFRVLSDQEQRIKYVLELKGLLGDSKENVQLPAVFLAEMMDINENLMELEFDYDAEKHRQITQEVQEMEAGLDAAVAPLLLRWNEQDGLEADLIGVRDYFLKKRYLLRIKEKLSTFAADF